MSRLAVLAIRPRRSPFASVLLFVVGAFVGGGLSVGRTPDVSAADPSSTDRAIDFSRDVRPILAAHCWSCHGQDESTRGAGLRLDRRDDAVQARPDASAAIVPGKPEASLLVAKIDATDDDERMPPPSAKRPLSDAQKTVLKRWIAAGAPFAGHWAFEKPRRSPPPDAVAGAATLDRDPLDRFIHRELARRDRKPNDEASRATLIRRLTLDLTGLPPTLDELDQFLADDGPDAYDRLLDRLLSSPRYGERMAAHWLDLARYADTNGYNNDEHRTMWPWRDWVIRAFRRHQPYDQFLTEQLAGDLLPQPSLDQRIATGFNRNHVLTTEGGIIDEEYRVEYVADRVHTTSTVFLGLSLQCARCHDHKYDPISQRDYYQFFAYFNVLPDRGVGYNKEGTAAPAVRAPTDEQAERLAALDRRSAELEALRAERAATAGERTAAWEKSLGDDERRRIADSDAYARLALDETSGAAVVDSIDPARRGAVAGKATWTEGRVGGALEFDGATYASLGELGAFDATDRFSFAVWVRPTASEPIAVLSKMDDAAQYRGYDLLLESGRPVVHLIDRWPDNAIKVVARNPLPLGEWRHVVVSYDGSRKASGLRLFVDGKPQEVEVASDKLSGTLKTDKPFHLGRRQSSLDFRGRIDDLRIFKAALNADDAERLAAGRTVSRIADLLAVPAERRDAGAKQELERFYLDRFDPQYASWTREASELPGRREALLREIPQVMVMEEGGERRPTRLLKRGQYDQPGDEVRPGVPASIAPPLADASPDRLGLARWLCAPDHPLTARVAVNRWWEMFFGRGLVETVEDFGTTGASPTHPELLDALAVDLVESGWDAQRLQRRLLGSSAYRRSSSASADARRDDPDNVWLARGPRFRLPVETIRDQALAVAGLFVERQGGPSVMPYQPDGLWEDVSVERRYKYQTDAGAGLYRRTMYTYWKRTCPPPALSTFDAPTRETCTIRRARTNTPLQALVLLNDPTYVEAARGLAQRTLQESPDDDVRRLDRLVRSVTARQATEDERTALRELLAAARLSFQADQGRARELLSVGRSPVAPQFEPLELAAWSVVAATVLNLDEALTKE